MPTVQERVIKIIADEFGRRPEDITRETKFWDPSGLDAIRVNMCCFFSREFEKEFGFTMDFSLIEAGRLQIVGDIVDLVEKLVAKGVKGRQESPGLVV